MRTTTERYIDASKETIAKLAKLFGVDPKYIYMCLTYRSGSATARKVRYTAVREYGARPMAHYPECETMHDTEEGGRQVMRQTFDNGATLRVDKQTGEVWITDRRGEEVRRCTIVKINDLWALQAEAENM